MGRYFFLVAVAVVLLLTTCEALLTTLASTPAEKSDLYERSLRTIDTTKDKGDEAATAEERGIIPASVYTKLSEWATKANLPKTGKNLQMRAWLKEKRDPNFVYAALKLKGKPVAEVKADPMFQTYLAYSKIWNKLGGRYMN
uniref:RxLR effector protein n=1 Tax=Phytophthora agathidicida TaxID=1642459 RepID=A0A7G4WI30_9STRA|nr:PaRXLR41 [Phytophthora agathidicida]